MKKANKQSTNKSGVDISMMAGVVSVSCVFLSILYDLGFFWSYSSFSLLKAKELFALIAIEDHIKGSLYFLVIYGLAWVLLTIVYVRLSMYVNRYKKHKEVIVGAIIFVALTASITLLLFQKIIAALISIFLVYSLILSLFTMMMPGKEIFPRGKGPSVFKANIFPALVIVFLIGCYEGNIIKYTLTNKVTLLEGPYANRTDIGLIKVLSNGFLFRDYTNNISIYLAPEDIRGFKID